MSQEIYCIAPNQDRAKQVVEQMQQLAVPIETISVVDERSGISRVAHPESDEFRNAVKGSVVGALIGLLYGIATLVVIGAAFIPGVLGAGLILGYSALGGVLFGAIIGSTGMFARPRLPSSLKHKYEEEVGRGGVLISVELKESGQTATLMSAIKALGLSEIHCSGKHAA
jgi:hypothetical protein